MLHKTKIRLWPILLMVGLLATFASMNLVTDTQAERTIPPYSMTYTTAKIPLDSTGTGGVTAFVDSMTGTAVPFFFTNLGDYGDIEGYIYIESTIISPGDTGDAAADIADTSKDSLAYTMYSSFDYGRTVEHIIEYGSLTVYAGGKSYDTVPFTLPPGTGTSGIGDNVYFKFTYAIHDTDYSVARTCTTGGVCAGVQYRIRIHMQPKR